jgi:hypothetical protein
MDSRGARTAVQAAAAAQASKKGMKLIDNNINGLVRAKLLECIGCLAGLSCPAHCFGVRLDMRLL